MSTLLPDHYTSLRPFRSLFRDGLPILTYHKLGPRPPRARLNGLYVETGLFSRQLAELRAAGFHAASLDSVSLAAKEPLPSIVLTFDDGFCNVLEHGLTPLAEHGFQPLPQHQRRLLLPRLLRHRPRPRHPWLRNRLR